MEMLGSVAVKIRASLELYGRARWEQDGTRFSVRKQEDSFQLLSWEIDNPVVSDRQDFDSVDEVMEHLA
jgi:hypothetical protein